MLRLETRDHISRLVMNHGKVNVMDIEFCRELIQHLETLEQDSCRALILSGNERVFSAGVDLKRWLAEGEDYVEPFLLELERVMERMFVFPKPVIAVIQGHAVAGGCMMAAACDYRLIAPQARIGIPELRVGVPLPMMAIDQIPEDAGMKLIQKPKRPQQSPVLTVKLGNPKYEVWRTFLKGSSLSLDA